MSRRSRARADPKATRLLLHLLAGAVLGTSLFAGGAPANWSIGGGLLTAVFLDRAEADFWSTLLDVIVGTGAAGILRSAGLPVGWSFVVAMVPAACTAWSENLAIIHHALIALILVVINAGIIVRSDALASIPANVEWYAKFGGGAFFAILVLAIVQAFFGAGRTAIQSDAPPTHPVGSLVCTCTRCGQPQELPQTIEKFRSNEYFQCRECHWRFLPAKQVAAS